MSLGTVPRFPLANLPTPLHELPRLREALGGSARCPRILIKRDDLTGLALGGNKLRKLEFLVADALEQGATDLITTGAAQSNHCRQTAAAARLAGLDCHLVLVSNEPNPAVQGNLLLDHLLGATVHLVDGDAPGAMEEVAAELESKGRKPYSIPAGGSSPVGVFGYVAGVLELVGQLVDQGEDCQRLYYASGSRGTQAGLVLGSKLYGAPYQVYGVAVSPTSEERDQYGLGIANRAAEMLGLTLRVQLDDLITDSGYFGEAYGVPTAGCIEAIKLLARTEGIILDPVYTAKAMAGLIDHVRSGVFDPSSTIAFLHTGGSPAIFAHGDALL